MAYILHIILVSLYVVCIMHEATIRFNKVFYDLTLEESIIKQNIKLFTSKKKVCGDEIELIADSAEIDQSI